ncbi:dimethyladenosine transferase 1, mitochondrial [Mytilus galloprovincialis]|uniref:rRNA adenine N(6)-methyltransferase n=2 Tax=Mytilus galloprovincialis TaxID=29158 RepID=A0A8B6GKR3_MYTGA|nr:dimethyladenosine transferase 1, mitochondrial [Mytilus galloprovincialis]
MNKMATKLPPLPSISEIVRMYKLKARKQLSQNFLLDMNLTKKIVKAAGNISDGYVCEIGPGPGGISRSILEKDVRGLAVIEKDKRFIPSLQMLGDAGGGKMKIYHGDILQYDMDDVFPSEIKNKWEDEPPNLHLIGNLPFNVSTPLIIKLLHAISERRGPWKHGRVNLTLTFQEEVGYRMSVPPGDKERCRLSVMCQHLCHVDTKFIIPGSAFVPAPKVNVAVVTFNPLKKPLISQPFKLVEKVARHTFHYKQKMVRKGIETLFPPDMPELTAKMFELSEVNPNLKPINLTNEEIGRLCHVYNYICEQHPYILSYDYRSPQMKDFVRKARQIEMDKIEQQIILGPSEMTESKIAPENNT